MNDIRILAFEGGVLSFEIELDNPYSGLSETGSYDNGEFVNGTFGSDFEMLLTAPIWIQIGTRDFSLQDIEVTYYLESEQSRFTVVVKRYQEPQGWRDEDIIADINFCFLSDTEIEILASRGIGISS